MGIILQISVPEVGKNWDCSLTLSDDKLYHLTIDKLGTLFLCGVPIVRHPLIGGISSPRSAPLKTCRWGRDTIICFLAPPSEPSIMCGHKAAQQKICICFLYPSSSSHQTMPGECVFRALLCFQSLGMGPLPSLASLKTGRKGTPCCVEKEAPQFLQQPEDGQSALQVHALKVWYPRGHC